MKWWDWSDPAFTFAFITIVISFLSFIATVIIPVLLRRLEEKSNKNQKILDSLERLTRSQRIDYLTKRLKESQDAQELAHLGEEVEEWPEGPDKDDLARLYCNNLYTPLHKYSSFFLRNYLALIMKKFVKRFRIKQNGHEDDLKYFIERLKRENLDVPYERFAEVYTDPESALNLDKIEGYQFYRKLVRSTPEMSRHLMNCTRSSVLENPRYGGFKFNILVGVLMGSLEFIEGNTINDVISYKNKLIHSLAAQMYPPYRTISDMDDWDLSGYNDTPTMLAAWLVDTIGFLSDRENIFNGSDQHCLGRIIETLPDTLKGIYKQAHKKFSPDYLHFLKWGKDDRHVRRGVETIKKNQPDLWQQYGEAIEKELDKVGSSWRNADLSSLAWDL